jgi:hypothetical protein
MRPALDSAGHRVPRTKPTFLLHTWRPHRQRPYTLVLHPHQHQSSRNLHLQYLAKNQSTQRCQSLITPGSDHPPVLEPHMVLTDLLLHCISRLYKSLGKFPRSCASFSSCSLRNPRPGARVRASPASCEAKCHHRPLSRHRPHAAAAPSRPMRDLRLRSKSTVQSNGPPEADCCSFTKNPAVSNIT